MKKYLFFITCTLLTQYVCGQSAVAPAAKDFPKLYWLGGNWHRLNAKPGRNDSERWIKTSDTQLQGWGISMKGADTAFVEKLLLLVKEDRIFYVAETAGNNEPVYFTLTSVTNNGFVCENPAHDFPKKISYRLAGNTITASISGNGKSIDYIFEKK